MLRPLPKTIWKKGIPIPTGYIMEKMCYTENCGIVFITRCVIILVDKIKEAKRANLW